MREEMRRKNEGGKRKGREEEHALRGRASSILRNSDIALYSASPPSYGPLDRHALPRNHGKTGGRKKWRWRWNRKRRREKSIVSLQGGRFYNPFSRVARWFRNQEGRHCHLLATIDATKCLSQDAIRKNIESGKKR